MPVRQNRRGFKENLAGHFKMEDQGLIWNQIKEDELAFASDFPYDGSRYCSSENFLGTAKNSRIENLNRLNLFANQDQAKTTDDGFNFWQLGHIVLLMFLVWSSGRLRLWSITGDEPFQLSADTTNHAYFIGLEADP